MSQADREKWNQRYAAEDMPPELELGWLDALNAEIPQGGRGLDIASGTGRASLWMARRGLAVTAVDIAERGLEIAASAFAREGLKLETLALDLETDPLPACEFQMITCMRYIDRQLFARLQNQLAPGGVLALEMVNVRNRERHQRPPREYLVEVGETLQFIGDLELLYYREGWQENASLARALARRR